VQTKKFLVRRASLLFKLDRVGNILHRIHPSVMLVDGHSTLLAKHAQLLEKHATFGKANHFAPRCPEKGSKSKASGGSSSPRQEHGANTNNRGNKADGSTGQKSKMARIKIGNVKESYRDHHTPIISVELLDSNGIPTRPLTTSSQTGAEVSVGGLDFNIHHEVYISSYKHVCNHMRQNSFEDLVNR
jgi:hypothetical protein